MCIRDRVPPALWSVLARALQKRPELRFAHAQEMADALADACPPARDGEVGQLMRNHFPERLQGFERLERIHLNGTPPAVAPRAAPVRTPNSA